jgi:transcriptional regulator with XRE-family HTH domain
MKLGEGMKKAREAAGLSQKDVYERTGINNKTLSNYERDISEPDTDNLRKLCTLYKISADELIDIPLSDAQARVLYRRYQNSPRNIQEAIEKILDWKPSQSDDQG